MGELDKLHMIGAYWLFMGPSITVVMLLCMYTQLIVNIWPIISTVLDLFEKVIENVLPILVVCFI